MKKYLFIFVTMLCLGLSLSLSTYAQGGDYLNEQEVDRVRDAQEIDVRTKVFLRIAERRLDVLLGVSPPTINLKEQQKKDKKDKKKKEKEAEVEESQDYGPEPQGTPTELLRNYSQVISELFDKLDDVYERKQADPKIAKAVDKLLDESEKSMKRLKQLESKLKSDAEEQSLRKAVEVTQMAIEGAKAFKAAAK